MKIALIANNEKKDLLTGFCLAYIGILKEHKLCATAMTSSAISAETGLKIESYMSGNAGIQQISSRVALKDIDMVIYIRDFNEDRQINHYEYQLLRLCDENKVPYATNIPTAEMLILGLKRGDLNWREYSYENMDTDIIGSLYN